MKSMNKRIVIAAGIAALLLAGCHKEKKRADNEIPRVEVATPIQDSVVVHKIYPGFIRAAGKADVVARVNGQILSRNYEEGAYVRKGAVLFTIESRQYADAVSQARASLATAKSQLDYATRQHAAMAEALKADAVSQMEVIESENTLHSAEAQVKSCEAALATALDNLSHCTVTAPVSGHITAPSLTVGNYVNGAGAPVTLATIYDDAEVKAVFEIEDSRYLAMSENRKLGGKKLYDAIPLDFGGNLKRNYTADLYYSAPAVNSSTGTVTLEGRVSNPDGELKDGMYVKVALPGGVEPKALLVSDASIGTDQRGKYLYLVNDSDKVVYTPVEVGELYNDTLRVITKGVTPGSRYVTKALLTVRSGERVKPISAKRP